MNRPRRYCINYTIRSCMLNGGGVGGTEMVWRRLEMVVARINQNQHSVLLGKRDWKGVYSGTGCPATLYPPRFYFDMLVGSRTRPFPAHRRSVFGTASDVCCPFFVFYNVLLFRPFFCVSTIFRCCHSHAVWWVSWIPTRTRGLFVLVVHCTPRHEKLEGVVIHALRVQCFGSVRLGCPPTYCT